MANVSNVPEQEAPKTKKAAGAASPRKTLTNWRVFNALGMRIRELTCDGYKPVHRANLGCHSRVRFEDKTGAALTESVLGHLKADHGGGFLVSLFQSETPTPLWNGLEDAGIELIDFRCDVCDKALPLNAIHIRNHMGNHLSKNRRTQKGGMFWMTISTEAPVPDEQDAFEE